MTDDDAPETPPPPAAPSRPYPPGSIMGANGPKLVPHPFVPGEMVKPGEAHRLQRAHDRDVEEAVVVEIVQAMASGLWLPGHSAHELSRTRKLSVGTIRRLASTASFIFTAGRSHEYLEEYRASAVARLELISVRALAKGEHRAATEATNSAARLAGVAYAPIRHVIEFAGPDGRINPQADALLREGPRAALEAAFAHLRTNPGDFEGARARGLAAAPRALVETVIDAEGRDVSAEVLPAGIVAMPPEEDDLALPAGVESSRGGTIGE